MEGLPLHLVINNGGVVLVPGMKNEVKCEALHGPLALMYNLLDWVQSISSDVYLVDWVRWWGL